MHDLPDVDAYIDARTGGPELARREADDVPLRRGHRTSGRSGDRVRGRSHRDRAGPARRCHPDRRGSWPTSSKNGWPAIRNSPAAFDELTPGRRREYNLHVSGAKQASTRDRRGRNGDAGRRAHLGEEPEWTAATALSACVCRPRPAGLPRPARSHSIGSRLPTPRPGPAGRSGRRSRHPCGSRGGHSRRATRCDLVTVQPSAKLAATPTTLTSTNLPSGGQGRGRAAHESSTSTRGCNR
jgi:hypothetical protein